jgi:tRNA U34 5-carboxymethylaminomethyl modifying GTPase MnmE/TrmE
VAGVRKVRRLVWPLTGACLEELLLKRLVDIRHLRCDLEESFGRAAEFNDQELKQHLLKLKELESALLNHLIFRRTEADKNGALTVAVVGDFSSGKSTFINALLGEPLCPVDVEPTQSVVTQFSYGEKFVVEEELPNGMRREVDHKDYTERVQHKGGCLGGGEFMFHIRCPSQTLANLRLIDTPGFGNPKNETVDNARTMRAVQNADVLFVILDANKGNPSAPLIEQIKVMRSTAEKTSLRPAFLLINKADLKPRSERAALKKKNERIYSGLFNQIELVSAVELAHGTDEPVLASVRAHFGRIERAIRSRQNIESTLSAAKDQNLGTYQLAVDGNAMSLPVVSREDLATREDLKSMVERVCEERIPLLANRSRREIESLRDRWKETLSEIRRWLKHSMSEASADDPNDSLSVHINDVRNETRGILSDIFKDASEEMFFPDVEVKKGFFFDDHCFGIVFQPEKLISKLEMELRWQDVDRLCKKFENNISQHFNVTASIEIRNTLEFFLGEFRPRLVEFRRDFIKEKIGTYDILEFIEKNNEMKGLLGTQDYLQAYKHRPSEWENNRNKRDACYAQWVSYGKAIAERWANEFIENYLILELNKVRYEVSRMLGKRSADQTRILADFKRLYDRTYRLIHSAPWLNFKNTH